MKSDVYVTKVKLESGFEKVIKDICFSQASREEPRKLVSACVVEKEVVLFFELA